MNTTKIIGWQIKYRKTLANICSQVFAKSFAIQHHLIINIKLRINMYQPFTNNFVHIDEKSLFRIDLQLNDDLDPSWDLRCFFRNTDYHILSDDWDSINLYCDAGAAMNHFMLIKHLTETEHLDVMQQHFEIDIKNRFTTRSLNSNENIVFTDSLKTKTTFAMWSIDTIVGFSKTESFYEVKRQIFNVNSDVMNYSCFAKHVYWFKEESSYWEQVFQLFQDNQKPENVF